MAKGMGSNFNAKSVDAHRFAMIPRADIPRSTFTAEHGLKTTFNAGDLVPMYCEEVLPGDSHRMALTSFLRMSTPIVPIMDNLYFETFFFFVPNRLLWENWKRFMGEQPDPDSSIDFVVPQLNLTAAACTPNSLFSHMGIPSAAGQWSGTAPVNALPFRAYNLIYNEWFRDQNMQFSASILTGNGPDAVGSYSLRRRGKRHDYFTSALPFAQKGPPVGLPLSGDAPVRGIGFFPGATGYATGNSFREPPSGDLRLYPFSAPTSSATFVQIESSGSGPQAYPLVYADLSEASGATINQLRQAMQIQRLLERDARGGTRYTELVRSHFGVISPDARLQRPEYLGGGSTRINITPVAQQSATGVTGGATPLGSLGGVGATVAGGHAFNYSATEHGYIIGLMNVRADLTYQQGLSRMWTRRTKYDFYWPVFAHLGEQPVFRKELYFLNNPSPTEDDWVFGYQERWAEYRYKPSRIGGRFASYASDTLDLWHLAQRFTTSPVLGDTFITENPPVSRVIALGETATTRGQEFIIDAAFTTKMTRPMPMYSVPGLMDHF